MKQQIAVAALYLTGLVGTWTGTGFLADTSAKIHEMRIDMSDTLLTLNCIGPAEYAERIEKITQRLKIARAITRMTPQPYAVRAIDYLRQSPSSHP